MVGAIEAIAFPRPAQFEIAFTAQVRMCPLVVGWQGRVRHDKRRMISASRPPDVRENKGAEGVVQLGLGGY